MNPEKRRNAAVQRELAAVLRAEDRLQRAALKKQPPDLQSRLEQKIPRSVSAGLKAAFTRGFALVFSRGSAVIGKTGSLEERQADHQIYDYAFCLTGRRKDFKRMRKAAGRQERIELAVTAAEGAGLGLLGIGMPDILLFTGMLLRGMYGLAVNYGFSYESRWEQMLILKMMEASVSCGEERKTCDRRVNLHMDAAERAVTEEEWNEQLERTANAFAADLLLMKFVQGLPLVGVIGGAANPIYLRKVMKYAELKYRRRYLAGRFCTGKPEK